MPNIGCLSLVFIGLCGSRSPPECAERTPTKVGGSEVATLRFRPSEARLPEVRLGHLSRHRPDREAGGPQHVVQGGTDGPFTLGGGAPDLPDYTGG